MSIDPIKKSIIKGYENNLGAKKGLQKFIFGNAIERTFDTEKVFIDIYDGKRGVAGYTARGANGQTVGLEGWETITVQPPLISENFNVTAQDLKLRSMGESGENNKNGQKLEAIVTRQIGRLEDRRDRKYNEQIVELLTDGKVTIEEKDDKGNVLATRVVDFNMPDAHKYTVATAWSDASADIFGDVRTIKEKIAITSGLTAGFAICGKSTIENMVNNDKIQKLIDNRRIKLGELVMENKGDGITYWGEFLGLDIFTFEDFKEDGTPLIPTDAFIVGSADAETDVVFGSLDFADDNGISVVEDKLIVSKTIDKKAKAENYEFESAKLYCLTQAGGFGCLTTA